MNTPLPGPSDVTADEALIEALRRGERSPDGDALAERLAAWRDVHRSGTGPRRRPSSEQACRSRRPLHQRPGRIPMTPDEADVSVDELADALRCAADGSPTREAAVELLVEGCRGHWLRRDVLREQVVLSRDGHDEPDPGPWFADLDWAALLQVAERGDRALYDTCAERTVLRVACELAAGWIGDGLGSCDRDNSQAIVDALQHAGQVGR